MKQKQRRVQIAHPPAWLALLRLTRQRRRRHRAPTEDAVVEKMSEHTHTAVFLFTSQGSSVMVSRMHCPPVIMFSCSMSVTAASWFRYDVALHW